MHVQVRKTRSWSWHGLIAFSVAFLGAGWTLYSTFCLIASSRDCSICAIEARKQREKSMIYKLRVLVLLVQVKNL
jgi:hypothetical protein